MDWSVVLGDLEDGMTTGKYQYQTQTAGGDKVASIFVERSHTLWTGDDVLKWMFEGCQRVVDAHAVDGSGDDTNQRDCEAGVGALDRYVILDPMDFQNLFLRIPEDANPHDPGLMDAALHYT